MTRLGAFALLSLAHCRRFVGDVDRGAITDVCTPRPENAARLCAAAPALGYVNGVLWSVGNGLTTGTLIYYLAQELGAKGTALSVLIAAPTLVGLLRLVTPALIGPLGGIKATCLKTSLASYLLLAIGLPAVTLVTALPRRSAACGNDCAHLRASVA